MKAFADNIERLTRDNTFFRQVIYTGNNCQLVLMALLPLEEIGNEVHHKEDQFIRIESGEALAVIDNVEYPLEDGSAVVIPSGTYHNIINTSKTKPLKLYTLYSPAHHADGTIHQTKADADKAESAE